MTTLLRPTGGECVWKSTMNTIEIYCPFTIVIDSAESLPFTFAGLRADARHGGVPLPMGRALSRAVREAVE